MRNFDCADHLRDTDLVLCVQPQVGQASGAALPGVPQYQEKFCVTGGDEDEEKLKMRVGERQIWSPSVRYDNCQV